MKMYEVINPYLVFSVKNGGKGRKDYALRKGDTVELSENDIAVRALLARQQIKEVAEQTAQTAAVKRNSRTITNQPVTA